MGSDRKSKRTSDSSPSQSKAKKSKDRHKSKHSRDDGHKDKHKSKRSKSDSRMGFQELSNDDYFAKNNEFATWLKEEKDVFFSDLLSESARELFADFVEAWNRGKLESRYYEGITSGPRTSHNWKIKK